MLRIIDHTVSGHDAVQTRASKPVMRNPLFVADVYELDPGPRHQQVVICGLAAIAAMMEPVGLDVRWKLAFNLSGVWVTACEHTYSSSAGCLPRPYQTICNEQVLGRPVAGRGMIGRPEDVAGLCRQRRHSVLASGVPGACLLARGLSA